MKVSSMGLYFFSRSNPSESSIFSASLKKIDAPSFLRKIFLEGKNFCVKNPTTVLGLSLVAIAASCTYVFRKTLSQQFTSWFSGYLTTVLGKEVELKKFKEQAENLKTAISPLKEDFEKLTNTLTALKQDVVTTTTALSKLKEESQTLQKTIVEGCKTTIDQFVKEKIQNLESKYATLAQALVTKEGEVIENINTAVQTTRQTAIEDVQTESTAAKEELEQLLSDLKQQFKNAVLEITGQMQRKAGFSPDRRSTAPPSPTTNRTHDFTATSTPTKSSQISQETNAVAD